MRRLSLVVATVVALQFSADASLAASDQTPPPVVSMITLLASKEKYDGKPVQVSGFLSVTFEDNALYFDENAYVHQFTENALWIEYDDADRPTFENYNRHPGYVIGVFKANGCGHLCLYGGAIVGAKLGLMYKER
jgi:hypothetical protein